MTCYDGKMVRRWPSLLYEELVVVPLFELTFFVALEGPGFGFEAAEEVDDVFVIVLSRMT